MILFDDGRPGIEGTGMYFKLSYLEGVHQITNYRTECDMVMLNVIKENLGSPQIPPLFALF